jgi:hypothetical protein
MSQESNPLEVWKREFFERERDARRIDIMTAGALVLVFVLVWWFS